jgi:hypothetical protein
MLAYYIVMKINELHEKYEYNIEHRKPGKPDIKENLSNNSIHKSLNASKTNL